MKGRVVALGSLLALALVVAGCGGGGGLVRRESFAGNNTPGPYFLTYAPIADGTELVRVDGRPQRFGEDYTIDYDTGQLWFEPPGRSPRIIPTTSIISVRYQSAGTGGGGTRSAARFQEDLFQGFGSTGPFDVRFSPILADGATATINGRRQVIRDALTVLVDGEEQREGVDYDAIRQIGRIIFRQIVPPTAVVRVRYYYAIPPTALTPPPAPPSGTWPADAE